MPVVAEGLGCFRACCRLLGMVLEHHARKAYSCTLLFASLCPSLLRLFFRLVLAPTLASDSGTGASPSAEQLAEMEVSFEGAVGGLIADSYGSSNSRFALSLGEQVAAASVLSRVLEQLLPHKEILGKYAAFFLAAYVSLLGVTALEPAPRAALLSGFSPSCRHARGERCGN